MQGERVLVVPRGDIDVGPFGFFPDPHPTGYRRLLGRARFLDREKAETNPDWKQLIPYLTVVRMGSCFLMRRGRKQSEARLHDRCSLGVGGHIDAADRRSGAPDLVLAGLYREMAEEVVFTPPPPSPRYLGLINDDESEVGQVHLGLAFLLLLAEGEEVSIRERDRMTGTFVPWEDLVGFRDALEGWSRILLEAFWDRPGRSATNRIAHEKEVP